MLLWFGASISIADILTGTLLAPMGFEQGVLAIVVGHFIGAGLLILAGLIGATSGLSATVSFRISFGRYGSYVFSVLNLLQLLGWTAVMIISGAKALDGISKVVAGYQNEKLWCIMIGGLILFWIILGIRAIFRIHSFVVMALFFCFAVLAYNVFSVPSAATDVVPTGGLSFGEAVELNVAMCISWLPLISDYSRTLKKPISGTIMGGVCYFVGGSMMFTVGLGAALFTGISEISDMLLAAGMGVAGLFVVAFSTVTTTFLDTHSSGVSAANISSRLNERTVAMVVCALGVLVAMFVPMSQYENFLYMIGSVFAPLFSILLVDFFIFKRRDIGDAFNVKNFILWLVGFALYRTMMSYSFVLGVTFPVMLVISAACFVVNKVLLMQKSSAKSG